MEDFLLSGGRLWRRFKQLLKACELYVWKAAKRERDKGVSRVEIIEKIMDSI
jgi:hypothetical protein